MSQNKSNRENKKTLPWMWIGACLMGAGVVLTAIGELLRMNGLELIEQSVYYMQRGIIISGAAILLVSWLRRFPKEAFIKNMITVLGMVVIVSTWVYIYMWAPYLKMGIATYKNDAHTVTVVRSFMYDDEVAVRLNEASKAYMDEAREKAREAQANGETVEEVANTVYGVDMLEVYNAYPVKLGLFIDTRAEIEGNVYTLLGATSAKIQLEWQGDDVAHLYVEGAEGEGDSYTKLK